MNYETNDNIDKLRQEIDWCDSVIIGYLHRRMAISQEIGRIRTENGGPRLVAGREKVVQDHYGELGEAGRKLADAVLELSRGPADTVADTEES